MEKPTSDEKEFLLERLSSPSFCVKYLAASMRESAETFLMALRNVADALKGMKKLSIESGLNRESLYKMLSEEGNPRLESLWAVVEALGFRLTIEPVAPSAPTPIYDNSESKTVDSESIGKSSTLNRSMMSSGNSHTGVVHEFWIAGAIDAEAGNKSSASSSYYHIQQAPDASYASYFTGLYDVVPKKPPQMAAGLNDFQQGGTATSMPQLFAAR